MAYVYQLIRLDTNEVFYVGVGKENKRASDKRGRNKYWHHIVNKVGYSAQIILDGITWEEACQKEKELIEYYGRKDLGLGQLVNMTNGGEGVPGIKRSTFSKEHRQKMADAKIGKKLSEEHKEKMSLGQKNSWYSGRYGSGRRYKKDRKSQPLSKEHKQKLSDAFKGIPQKKVICPRCLKEGGISNMKKYHFDNCKAFL